MKNISKNKRGFLFTLVVLFLIILLLLISFEYRQNVTKESLRTRVLATNNFIKSMESDASREIYISSYRAMLAIMEYFTTQPNPKVENPSATFRKAMFENTLDGSGPGSLDYSGADNLLVNTTLDEWQDRMKNIATATGFEISFGSIDDSNLSVSQADPWHIIVSIPVEYTLSDHLSNIKWHRIAKINATLSIINGFEDPLYIIKFGPSCTNKIIQSPYSYGSLVEYDGSCDADNLLAFLNTNGTGTGSMYIASNRSPSYLNRLKGNLSYFIGNPNAYDQYGIESLINLPELGACSQQTLENQSTITDIYYDEGFYVNLKKITGLLSDKKSWVKIDATEAQTYYGIPPACLESS